MKAFYQLRRELEAVGHKLTIEQLRESLYSQVMKLKQPLARWIVTRKPGTH